MAEDLVGRRLMPRGVLAAIGILVVAALTVLSGTYANDTAPPFTSYSAGPYGTRGLFEILHRLGWRVERRLLPLNAPLDTTAVYAVLAPPLPLTTNEVRDLLAAVRRGASAIVVPRRGTALADSLHIAQSSSRMTPYVVLDTTRSRRAANDTTADAPGTDSAGSEAAASTRANGTTLDVFWRYLTASAPLPPRTVTFVAVRDGNNRARPVVLGVPLGRGRLVVVADARIFRNGVVRAGDAAVLDTRLVEWLTRSPRSTIVFDEYHHGFGDHGSLRRAIRHALLGTPAGRMLTQLLAAALVLLVAAGMRAIPPLPRPLAPRRSPTEHADALARAYEQVGATRTATRRLLCGLRRRHPFGPHGVHDDEAFLDALRARYPALAEDVELVRGAIRRPLAPNAFLAVGQAINQMERMLAS